MKILLVFLVCVCLAFGWYANRKERRNFVQFFDAPNGQKYRATGSIKLPRFQWWVKRKNIEILQKNL